MIRKTWDGGCLVPTLKYLINNDIKQPKNCNWQRTNQCFYQKENRKVELGRLKKKTPTSSQGVDWTLDLSPQQHHSKAVLQGKLKGVQFFESEKPRVFSNIRISIKRLRFPYCPRIKVSCRGNSALLENGPAFIHYLLKGQTLICSLPILLPTTSGHI